MPLLRLLPLLIIVSCASQPRLRPFTSDGCSLFPDRDSQRGDSWCACCVEHDFAYWKGGTDAQRLAADSSIAKCVLKRTGDSALAGLVFTGTRAGGSPLFPTWYRWGYGWPYKMQAIPDSLRARLVREKGGMDRAAMAREICGE